VLHSPEFADQPPAEVYATLLEQRNPEGAVSRDVGTEGDKVEAERNAGLIQRLAGIPGGWLPSSKSSVPSGQRRRLARTVTSAEARLFWAAHAGIVKRRGCYVFAIRSRGRLLPVYVGRASRSFRQEVLAPHKLAKLQLALVDHPDAAPCVILLAAPRRTGAPNVRHLAELERFLIEAATTANPNLLNVARPRPRAWSIAGIRPGLRATRPGPASELHRLLRATA